MRASRCTHEHESRGLVDISSAATFQVLTDTEVTMGTAELASYL
jgi:hypothetical protein